MQALPLTGFGGGDGSLIWAFRRDAEGEVGSLPFLFFFVDVFRLVSGEADAAVFLRFFFADAFGASGVVDISRSGSL
jgi:hypothetical protein